MKDDIKTINVSKIISRPSWTTEDVLQPNGSYLPGDTVLFAVIFEVKNQIAKDICGQYKFLKLSCDLKEMYQFNDAQIMMHPDDFENEYKDFSKYVLTYSGMMWIDHKNI